MIQGFRKIFQSRIGLALVLAFVGLIALAFASADVTGFGFGGVAGSERAATVGDERITTADLRGAITSAYEAARQENPELSLDEFLSTGAVDEILDQLIARAALYDFGRQAGVRIGDSLIGSELTQIPAFQGADGNFSEQAYRQALQGAGISDSMLRKDVENGLVARMMLSATTIGTESPRILAERYAGMLNETRKGSIALLPAIAFAGEDEVSDATLKTFLADNRADYLLPERRTIRYAVLNGDALGAITASEAEIAARYRENAAQYRGSEQRTLTQLVLPTQAAANAIVQSVNSGATLAAAASQAGLATTQIAPESRAALASSASPAVAQAAYEAQRGALVGPVRGPLGWYVLRLDGIDRTEDRSLASVRGELEQAIVQGKRREALANRASEVEERLSSGASLAEVARMIGAEVQTTGPVLEDGTLYQSETELPADVARVVPTIYAMDASSDPQIAAGANGETYIVFAPGKITRSAPPAFAELRPTLLNDYRREKGNAAARRAADSVLKAMKGGKTLPQALAALDQNVPPANPISLSRRQLMASGQQVPPPLALMFTMAEGSEKRIEAPRNGGWFIVALDEIETPELDADDPLIESTRGELATLRGNEYAEQLNRAIRNSRDVRRNDGVIAAVREQLAGSR
ncbi:peptidylprolyl isomerase [Croceicoccus hydrothermalis]|uniref:peptidylprolyl isomerase n=1 Tax=Croceicoccus hydrothermalis TaxID=2867964 RepID=UPI001EFA5BD2|nr:peptidylprolyl isomerase [Croceicoccus hydrothermalis]